MVAHSISENRDPTIASEPQCIMVNPLKTPEMSILRIGALSIMCIDSADVISKDISKLCYLYHADMCSVI